MQKQRERTQRKPYNIAIRMLARREHSALELSTKLSKKGFEDDVIAELLTRLITLDLQSDERFTECYTRSRKNRGYGPTRIKQELQQRGISAEMIANYLQEDDSWVTLAYEVRLKKFGWEQPEDFTEKAKALRFLLYRGFTTEQANASFKID